MLGSKCLKVSCLIHSKGGLIVILWTVLVNQLTIYSNGFLFGNIIEQESPGSSFWFYEALSFVQFVGFLLYPITGLLADIYWTRFKTMYAGLFFNILGALALSVASFLTYYGQATTWPFVLFGIVVPLGITQFGVALFSSNAIQFATDQMPGASSDNLSALVYWYVWAIFFGQGEGSILLLIICLFTSFSNAVYLSILIVCVIQTICLIVGLIAITLSRHKLVNEPAGRNPIKRLAKVLRYSWHHKASRFEYRSAFTYGIEAPSRLDFAKQRFGGLYTTEEVEDTKSFFRILLVLLSLMGFCLMDETMSTNLHMQQLRTVLNLRVDGAFDYLSSMSFTGSLVTILVFIPVYQCCLRRCIKMPSMLKRMLIGLIFALLGVIVLQVIEAVLTLKVHTLTSCNRCDLIKNAESSCVAALDNNTSALNFNTALLPYQTVLIAQVFNGVAFLLVFLTAIEFILAQAPRLMQGFLIGIWFLLATLKTPIGMIMSIDAIDCQFYAVGFRIAGMILFLPVYIVIALKYKRRERDEYTTINQQNVIEEYCIRALDRRDKYYQELTHVSINNYYK